MSRPARKMEDVPSGGSTGGESADRRPWVFITWYPYCRRSDVLAEQIGARSYLVHFMKFKVPYLAPIKYVLQGARTAWILFKERPSVVLVANPPFVAPLAIWVFSVVLGYRFAIDAHSGAFQHLRWKWSLPLQRFLARRALTNIVTNEHMEGIIRSWGAKAEKIQDLALNLNSQGPTRRCPRFHVVFVCTYSVDEPVDEVVKAARLLEDVDFTFTGDPFYAPRGFREGLPPNVHLTGFIPDSDYLALLRNADVVLVLTKEDHTMQRGGYEAMSLEKPLITSDWPLLKEVFSQGTIHVDNTAGTIVSAIGTMRGSAEAWKREMGELKRERKRISAAQVDRLYRVCCAAESVRRSG